MTGTVEELRSDPTPIKQQRIASIVHYYAELIGGLDAPPIVMGHSFGWLFALLLAYRCLGSAAVAIHPVAPAGILALPFSTLKASAPVLANPLHLNDATMLTPEQFHYAFTNTVRGDASRDYYDRYAIPCANHVFFEGAVENFVPYSPGRIDVRTKRSPLLIIAGGEDHLVTPDYARKNFRLVDASPSVTAFKEFPERPHFTGALPGWEAVADYALEWAAEPVANRLEEAK